jgi:hypothetical protein
VIEEAPESSGLLQVSGAAAAAQEAWDLAFAWRLDLSAIEASGNDDARAFAGWARRFEQICRGSNWIVDAQALDALAAAVSALKLPAHILLAGFDELTPQQTDLIETYCLSGLVNMPNPWFAFLSPIPWRN